MEENNKTEESALSYEQLMVIAKSLQQRAAVAEQKLMSIDAATVRLGFLFKVLEYAHIFSEEYVKQCADEIVELLKLEQDTEE